MYVCNQQDYGMIMLPLEDHQNLEDDMEILRYEINISVMILKKKCNFYAFLKIRQGCIF